MSYQNDRPVKLTSLNQKEVLRLLGNRNTDINLEPTQELRLLMNECQRELLKTARPRYTYKVYDVDDPKLPLIGADISKLLYSSDKVVFFAATLSVEVDMLIRKAQIMDMSAAVILDSMANVAIEQVCDKIEIILEDRFEDYHFTRRFSPGYGDFPLSVQEDFLLLVDASKKIGLSLNESGLMTPVKSVTALLGMTNRPTRFYEDEKTLAKEKAQQGRETGEASGKSAPEKTAEAEQEQPEGITPGRLQRTKTKKANKKKSSLGRNTIQALAELTGFDGIGKTYDASAGRPPQEEDSASEEPENITAAVPAEKEAEKEKEDFSLFKRRKSNMPEKRQKAYVSSPETWIQDPSEARAPVYEDIDADYIKNGPKNSDPKLIFNIPKSYSHTPAKQKKKSAKSTVKPYVFKTEALKTTYAPTGMQAAGIMRREAKGPSCPSSHDCDSCNLSETCNFRRKN